MACGQCKDTGHWVMDGYLYDCDCTEGPTHRKNRLAGFNEAKEMAAKAAESKICGYMDGKETEKLAEGKPYCMDLADVIRALKTKGTK